MITMGARTAHGNTDLGLLTKPPVLRPLLGGGDLRACLPSLILYPHQVTALSHCLSRNAWALYMEQRLGKTLPAVRSIRFAGARRVLVVAPYSALRGWAETLRGEGLQYYVAARGPVAERDIAVDRAGPTWVLCPWQILAKMPHTIASQWDAVVVDESRIIANPKSAVSRATRNIRSRLQGILSGAPATEGPQEYYNQLASLGERWGGLNFWDWRSKWFRQSVAVKGGRWYPTKAGEKHITETVARYAYSLRRDDTPYALPSTLTVHRVQLPEADAPRYYRAEREFVREAKDGSLELTSWAGQRLVWLRRIADGINEDGDREHCAKLSELDSILDGVLKGHPCIVWCEYVAEVEYLQRELRGRTVLSIHGGINQTARDTRLSLWGDATDGVLVVQPQCMRYGADLSHADTAVWFSVPASLDTWLQAQERTRRIGVHAETFTHVLVTENTADETVWDALEEKDSDALRLHNLLQRIAARGKEPEWWNSLSTRA